MKIPEIKKSINLKMVEKSFYEIKNNVTRDKVTFSDVLFLFSILFLLIYIFFSTIFNMAYNDKKFINFDDISSIYSEDKSEESDISIKSYFKGVEDDFRNNFHNRINIIENYGLYKKILGKKMVENSLPNRYVFKGNNGFLYYISEKEIDHNDVSKNISSFQDKLMRKNIPFLTVLAPNKHNISSINFPSGVLDYTTINTTNLEKNLGELGVDSLNLSTLFYEQSMDENYSFFATDIYWRFEGAFWGYKQVLDYLSKYYIFDLEIKNQSNLIDNYTIKKYSNSYIGSMGRSCGKKYIDEKDDFNVLFPNFETNIVYKKYDDDFNLISEKRGTYEDVFINEDIFENNDDYADKYASLMGYYAPFEIIENKNAEKNSKLILIRDSFAMPVASYLSNNFSKIYIIDTTNDSIKKNLINIIDITNPDLVLMMFNPSSITYFPEMFNFD